jgi:Tol biopolymer transport system component
VLAAQVTQAPDPLERYRPAVPPALSAVLMRCLAKRPADRWQTAEELLVQLELQAMSSGGIPTAPGRTLARVSPARAGPRRWLWALGLLAGMAGMALLVRYFSGEDAPDVRFGHRVQVTLAPGLETQPALSPQGDLLAYTAGTGSRLYVRQVEGGNPIPVAPELAGPQAWPHWSPDGRQLSFNSPRGLEIVPALGGTPHLLLRRSSTALATFNAGAWSADGRELIVVQNDTLYAAPLEGGRPRLIGGTPELHSCAWSPGGAWIACVSGNRRAIEPGVSLGNLAQSAIALFPAKGGGVIRVTSDSSANGSPAWLPDGTLLFVSDRDGGRDVYALRVNGRGQRTGSPRRLTTGLNALAITLSANGSRMGYAVFSETSNIWSLPLSSGHSSSVIRATQVTSGNQVIESFDVSPNGDWLVFDSDRSGNADLYRVRLDVTREPEQLTRSPVNEFSPVWSPDGSEIAFHSFRDGRRQIYSMSSDGGAATPLVVTNQDDRLPVWRPDGTGVLFLTNSFSSSSETRMVRRVVGKGWTSPARWRKPACVPSWSPAGEMRAVCMNMDGRLLVTNDKGDSLGVLTDRASLGAASRSVGWSSDGMRVYFLSADSASTNLYAVPAAGGLARLVVRFDDPSRPWHRYGFEIFRDRFYFTVGDQQSDIWVAKVEK